MNQIDLKLILPYIAIICSIGISWGMFSQRLDAVEKKADAIAQMQIDIAVIKEKILVLDDMNEQMDWMSDFLIKNYSEF